MKVWATALVVVGVLAVGAAFWRLRSSTPFRAVDEKRPAPPHTTLPAAAQPTAEQKLAELRALGIVLRPGMSHADLPPIATNPTASFQDLLIGLGADLQREPFSHLSDDVWHFDTECIEDKGSYVAIAERIRDLSHGALALTNIVDRVDIDAGVARLAFDLDGKHYDWKLAVNDDWVDPDVLTRFDALLAERGARLIYLDLEGQDCLLLRGDDRQLGRLRAATRLNFTRLDG